MAIDHPLLRPYELSDSDPWDSVKAGHLLNRAGFGGTPEEVEKVVRLGPVEAVDWLLDFPNEVVEESSGPNLESVANLPQSPAELRRMYFDKSQDERKELQQQFMRANGEATQLVLHWWLDRMATGPHPLQEKLTFFWHGHFTTSARDERWAMLIWRQNQLLRQNAAGNFETFLHQISRDPAMLDYLNNNENHKAHPNENYARELMELFTLGIGNYTETDVKEAARAFTGWSHDGGEFVFHRFQHDYGDKTFFGRTGNFDGDDIISMILLHPACRRFIATELFKNFAYEQPEESLATALGDVLYDGRYEIRPFLRTLFRSQAFYSDESVGVQIKSPVQLVVGTVRELGIQMPTNQGILGALNQMGQLPLNPPNVRGWPGGQLWINTSTLFVRYNTAVWLAGGAVPAFQRVTRRGESDRPAQASAITTGFDDLPTGSATEIVDAWVKRLIQRPIDEEKRQDLIGALGENTSDVRMQRQLVQLIVSMPEYQLC